MKKVKPEINPLPLKAIYPGSFDPPTFGHLDIIERAVKLFGSLTVLVAHSSRKSALFTPTERKALLEKSVEHLGGRVKVDIHEGLTADYARKAGASVLIRGLRAVSDFEYEFQMASINRKLYPDIETVVIMTGEKFYYIASTAVKEVAVNGGDMTELVPKHVAESIRKKYKYKGK